MPLEQVGLPSTALTDGGQMERSQTDGSGGMGGMNAAVDGANIKRATSLDTGSRIHSFGAPHQSHESSHDAAVASASHGSSLTLPRAAGGYSARFRSRWPKEEDEEDGIFASDDASTELADNDTDTQPYPAFQAPRDEMTLLKLSGLGGVQRSGSFSRIGSIAGQGARAQQPFMRTQYRSSLTISPEELSGQSDADAHPHFYRPTLPFEWQDKELDGSEVYMSSVGGVKQISSYGSPPTHSELPSPSSRASTSSSIAPARSRSTLSMRDSSSSPSSASASSSSKRLQNTDGGDGAQSGAAERIEDAASETERSTAAESETTVGRANKDELPPDEFDGESSAPYTVDEDRIIDPGEQVGPTVQRIRSIGRGNKADVPLHDDEEDIEQEQEQAGSPPGNAENHADNSFADNTITSFRSADENLQHTLSAEKDKHALALLPSPKLPDGLFERLTWSDAAQAPISPEQERPKFEPPAPRRHTGSYALRSKSALASGAMGQFAGGGRGRAALRRLDVQGATSAAGPVSSSSSSAFGFNSAVQAQSDKMSMAGVEAGAGITSPKSAIDAKGATAEQERFTARMGKWLSERDLLQHQRRQQQLLPGDESTSSGVDVQSSQSRSVGRRLSTGPRPSALAHIDNADPTKGGSQSEVVEEDVVHSPRSVVTNDAEIDSTQRPGLPRSSTQGGNLNVLRTPTTQEWSRYLIKKGLDPATMMQTAMSPRNVGRSRSNTAKSSTSLKGESSLSLLGGLTSLHANADESSASQSGHGSDTESIGGASQSQGSQMRSPRHKVTPRFSELSMSDSRNEDLSVIPERAIARRSASPASGAPRHLYEVDDDDQGEESDTSDSSFDERMRALHEAISRPASRMGSPSRKASFVHLDHHEVAPAPESAADHAQPRHWPLRETAAAVMGYPTAPSGERRTIDDFVITSEIGRGAYGLVKKARIIDPQTGQGTGPEFCIKYIIKSRILADCWRRHKVLGPIPVEIHVLDQLRRLIHHIPSQSPPWSAGKLLGVSTKESEGVFEHNETGAFTVGHPALCKMLDFFEDHEFYYLVMPCFGRGQDLFDYVESQPHGLSTLQVRSILGQLADGLKFLHANNIVHRDVKDENVILDGEGHIQLIDFGSAAHIHARTPGSSARRLFDTFSGTLDYAAAEILRGEKYGGKEQDVWALGVVGYVLLCGDCPFWNGEEAMNGLNEGARALAVLRERCAPPSPDVDLEDDIVERFTLESYADDDPFVGNAIARHNEQQGRPKVPVAGGTDYSSPVAHAARRRRDLVGQSDGGGCLADLANLIASCLDLDPAVRPTMDQIAQHRFLVGARGWTGSTWWLRDAQQTDLASTGS